MKILLIGLGIAVQLLVLVDMFKTIVYINGAGQLSNWVSKKVWRLFFIIARGNGDNKILNICGPIILLTFLFMWITLIWFGYSLIFISDHNSVLNNHTQEPATALGQVYYVGYTLTSLGNGDYRAGSGVWQIVSNIMGLNSMIFISLGISYILPVLQAVVDKRTLAVHIDKLGATPEEIIENGYNGDNFEPLYQRFSNLENLLIKHGERHLAYPILHYFHSNKKAHAVTLSLAVLDETITIQEVYQIDKSTKKYHWYILRGALDNFFERLDSSFILAAKEAPPFDYFEKLSDKFTMENKKECLKKIKNMEERRRKIKGYIRNDGWDWEDVKIARSKQDR